jgi:hypothetical protein
MTSSSIMDVLGGRLGSIGTCGRLEKPEGYVLLQDVPFALERVDVSLKGDYYFFLA